MSLRVERVNRSELNIPAVAFIPERVQAYAVIVHGYGGCKEEQFGIAWTMAESGVQAIAVDLRGHGENGQKLDEGVFSDVQDAVLAYKRRGKVIAVGHSLGGRLSLLSQADYKIGISPALPKEFSPATQQLITQMRAHRVDETHAGVIFETLQSLPVWQNNNREKVAVIMPPETFQRSSLDVRS